MTEGISAGICDARAAGGVAVAAPIMHAGPRRRGHRRRETDRRPIRPHPGASRERTNFRLRVRSVVVDGRDTYGTNCRPFDTPHEGVAPTNTVPSGPRLPPWGSKRSAVRAAERVSQDQVVREWLAREPGAESQGPAAPDAALDALLSAKPGAASFLWRETPVEWYRVELEREAFEGLRPVGGPPDLLWRSVAADSTLFEVAQCCYRSGDGALAEVGIDVSAVRRYRRTLADGGTLNLIVVRTRWGRTRWVVVDGNHRATAAGLHLLESGEYDPLPACLATVPNPVFSRINERVGGWIQRLLGRWPARLG